MRRKMDGFLLENKTLKRIVNLFTNNSFDDIKLLNGVF